MKYAVAYYRVSTNKQGMSRLGLEAQQQAVQDFIHAHGFALAGEFTEVESGKKNNRPILQEALAACKRRGAVLLIAKLDRLGRNVVFIAALMQSGVEFKAVDNPEASKLIVHIMAAFAEHERDQISERTKAALQAAKKRGVQLGSYGRMVLAPYNRQEALRFSVAMLPHIRQLQAQGLTTVRSITIALNQNNIPTYRSDGRRWHPSSVHRLLQRLRHSGYQHNTADDPATTVVLHPDNLTP